MPAEPSQGKNLETNTPLQKVVGQMNWFNEPPSVKLEAERLVVRVAPKTDFWRKTLYVYVSDNGHFLYASVSGDFTLEARIAGRYRVQYDQAGLMVRVDSTNWMKCGVGLSEGIGHATAVVTREFSDWSTVPGITTKAPVSWRIVRRGESLHVFYSVDNRIYVPIRLGYLALPTTVHAGIMCFA